MKPTLKIIECPRDAMQGLKDIIPTQKKIDYINSLLKVGFDTIDFGSFVSPTKMPQMADTEKVLAGLDLTNTSSKLLAITLNKQGAENAVKFKEIDYLGYPFSVSETFQLRNTNKSILESIQLVKEMLDLCEANNKNLVVYISMCFGNPYGDSYNYEIVYYWINELVKLGVKTISLSDTVGVATNDSISSLFSILINKFPNIEIGAHFHTRYETGIEKIEAAYNAGCRRFDGAIKGFGGCPMAKDDLVGNLPTEQLIDYFHSKNIALNINKKLFDLSFEKSGTIFNDIHV
jgi:hydroxymethylglutaryl-CoA lyase